MAVENDRTRLGFYYFPDAQHYREKDLAEWLPNLVSLGARWITLVAPFNRAIPESFLHGLMDAKIQPVLHFRGGIDPIDPQSIHLLLETYANWGIQHVAFFDRPNLRTSWTASNWTQHNLVERFLDIFLPLVDTARQIGLTPVFPPLEPGGDYWDTAFLRTALQGILRRGYKDLVEKMVLGAYAWPSNRSLNWGAGGPDKWPMAEPYSPDPSKEDQCGFRIFDWYLALSQAVLGKIPEIFLLGAGSHIGDAIDPASPAIDENRHTQVNLAIAQAVSCNSPALLPPGMDPIPPSVLACNFWLLAAEPGSVEASQAWFQPGGKKLPIVDSLKYWIHNRYVSMHKPDPLETFFPYPGKPIRHYLLLPSLPWGVTAWHLDVIQPFVQKYQPTIGFSIQEAAQADRVTIIGPAQSYPDATVENLVNAGCSLQLIDGNGTEIASKLSEL